MSREALGSFPQEAEIPTVQTDGLAAHHWRKRPVVVEAMRWPGNYVETVEEVMAFEDWFLGHGGIGRYMGDHLHIKTLEASQ